MSDETNTEPQNHKSTASATFGRIAQWVSVALSVIALLLGIVANLRVSAMQDGIGRSASELASALSSDGMSASSGSDTKAMKKTGKKTEVKTVEYTAAEGSVLEGDYDTTHVKLVKLEVTGTKATLTAEVSNNGTESNSSLFSVTAFQNGQQTGTGRISTDGQIQAGYTATVTTEFDIKDATQPVSVEVELYSSTLQVEFSPQN